MKKSFLIIFLLILTNCSRSSLEKGGWLPPEPQKSKFMKVEAGGFDIGGGKDSVELKYMVGVKLDNTRPNSDWLIAEFEDPANKNFVKKVFKLKPNQDRFLFYSDGPVCGLKDISAYLVKIKLSSDKDGINIVDSLEQYIRLSGMGLVFRQYKHC